MGKVINIQMDEDFYNEIIQGGGSGNGSGGEITMEYYRINWDFIDENGGTLTSPSYKDYRSIIAKAQYLNFYSNDEGAPMIGGVGDYYVSEDKF